MAMTEDESIEEVTHHKSNLSASKSSLLDTDGGGGTDDLTVADQISRLQVAAGTSDRQWKNLDSVHSHKSDLSALANHVSGGSFNNSFDFNDSCASFASFGGSEDGGGGGSRSSLNDSAGDVVVLVDGSDAAVGDRDPAPLNMPTTTKRNLLMNRLPESKLVRAASLRCPTLQLIEENDTD